MDDLAAAKEHEHLQIIYRSPPDGRRASEQQTNPCNAHHACQELGVEDFAKIQAFKLSIVRSRRAAPDSFQHELPSVRPEVPIVSSMLPE